MGEQLIKSEQISGLNYNYTQASHGFAVPPWLVLPLRLTTGGVTLAQANISNNKCDLIAIKSKTSDILQLRHDGYLRITHGLQQNTNWYLSPDVAGAVVREENLSDDAFRQYIFSTLDSEGIYIKPSSFEKPLIRWAKITNDVQTNLNSSVSGTSMIFDVSSFTGNSRLFVAQTDGIRSIYNLNSVSCYGSLYGTIAASSRSNVAIQISVNGLIPDFSSIGAQGYIRRANGHNESTSDVNNILDILSNDVIGIEAFRLANTPILTSPLNRSVLIVSI